MRTNPFLVALLLTVPLVVHLKRVPTPSDLLSVFPGYRDEGDLFSYWKSHVLLSLSLFSVFSWVPSRVPVGLCAISFGFISLVLLSTIFSEFPYLSVWGTPNYNEGALVWVAYFVVLLGGVQLPSGTLRRVLKWSVFTVGFFCGLQLLSDNFLMLPFIHPLVTSEEIGIQNRPIYGTLMNPNHLGLYCALLFPYFLSDRRDWWLLPFIAAMAFGSCSRAAFVSIALTSLYVSFGYRKAWLPVIALACAVFIFRPSYHGGLADRMFIYTNSIPLLFDTLVFGKGMATFLNYFPQGIPDGAFPHVIVDRPHNLCLQIAHGAGLPALLIFLLIVFTAVKIASLRERAAIIGFCIAALFTDSFVGVSPLFFAIVGNCWAERES
jgi:hypothetical protein